MTTHSITLDRSTGQDTAILRFDATESLYFEGARFYFSKPDNPNNEWQFFEINAWDAGIAGTPEWNGSYISASRETQYADPGTYYLKRFELRGLHGRGR